MQIEFLRTMKADEGIAEKAVLRRLEAVIGNYSKFGNKIIFRGVRKRVFDNSVEFKLTWVCFKDIFCG
jgi:hypothetical protein